MTPSFMPRHVLMTADTVGSVWTYTVDLCQGLKEHGVDVTLLTMGRLPDADQRRSLARLTNVYAVPTQYRLEWMRDCEADLTASGELLLALERKLKPDLVHVNGYWHAALPFHAPVLSAAHSCVPSWWASCRETKLPPEWSAYCAWVREAIAAADMLVAPTAAFLSTFQRLHGRVPDARVIWNGRDGTKFAAGVKRPIALAAGRLWDEAKNIALLCKAARGLDIRVAVAGDAAGPDGEPVAMDHVAVLGRLTPDELAQWMAQAAIFVAPARYEPSGRTILEAALSGCALVLGNIASLRELWADAAIFVDPEDGLALRHALRALAAKPHECAAWGERARARAAQYGVARMAASYADAYADLVSADLEAVA